MLLFIFQMKVKTRSDVVVGVSVYFRSRDV